MSLDKAYETRAWRKLIELYGGASNFITTEQLKSLAKVVSTYSNIEGIELTSKDLKNKESLINWFEKNYEKIFPWMEKRITIKLKDGTELNKK